MRVALLFLLGGLTFGGECVSEFCQYKQFFENATALGKQTINSTRQAKPFPVFRIPEPPKEVKEVNTTQKVKKALSGIKTVRGNSSKVVPLRNVVVVNTPSAVVKVSLTDMTRIVCPDEITTYAYSKEKLIEVFKSGNSLYIKFLPIKEWNPKEGKEEIVYRDYPRDLFVECGGQTFSLVLLPEKGLPPQEIYLQLPYKGIKKEAQKFERSFPYEETLMKLIKYAYKDKIPPGYEVKFVGKPYKEFKELSLYLNKEYIGDQFKVAEFVITAKKDLTLYEGMFVPFIPNALAIAIEKPILKQGEMTRLFVVEKVKNP